MEAYQPVKAALPSCDPGAYRSVPERICGLFSQVRSRFRIEISSVGSSTPCFAPSAGSSMAARQNGNLRVASPTSKGVTTEPRAPERERTLSPAGPDGHLLRHDKRQMAAHRLKDLPNSPDRHNGGGLGRIPRCSTWSEPSAREHLHWRYCIQ